MKRYASLTFMVGALVIFGGCSGFFTELAANQTVNVMAKAGASFDEESDPWLARAAATSNLKFFEGVLKASPENENLMVMIAKNYGLYTFAFLQDDLDQLEWGTPEYDALKARMINYYERTVGYAVMRMTLDYEDFAAAVRAPDAARIDQILADCDPEDHLSAMYWLAYGWGNLINLQNDDPSVVADLGRVKRLMGWVRAHDGTFQNGGPHLFFGAMHLALPPALGGQPEAAREAFEAGIAVTAGRFLLAKALYAHYYMVAVNDREGYERLLREVIDAPADLFPEQRLANELARIRAQRWLGEIDDYFDPPEAGADGSSSEDEAESADESDGGSGDLQSDSAPAPSAAEEESDGDLTPTEDGDLTPTDDDEEKKDSALAPARTMGRA